MKKYFSLFFLLATVSLGKSNSLPLEKLLDKNGIFYVKESKSPFTGMGIDNKNREFFKNGVPNGKWLSFYPNGNIKSIENWKNGILNGKYILYNKNGYPISKTSFLNGKDNGTFQLYHSNGQLQILGFFHEGTPRGVWKYYDKNGKLTGTVDYTKSKVYFDQKN